MWRLGLDSFLLPRKDCWITIHADADQVFRHRKCKEMRLSYGIWWYPWDGTTLYTPDIVAIYLVYPLLKASLALAKQLGSFGAKRCHNTGMSPGFLLAVKSMVWVSNSYLLGYNVPQREFIYNLLAPVGLKCLWWWFLHFQWLMTWLLFIRCEAWIGHDWLFLFLLTF